MSKKKRVKYDGPTPLDQEYRYQLRKRSGWDFATGLPSAALSGDREATKKCAGMAAVLVEDMPMRDDLIGVKEWLLWCLWQIEAGSSPDEAFRWKRRGKGRKREFETIFKQWIIGQHMHGLVSELVESGVEREEAIEKAAGIVATQRAVQPYTARDYFEKFQDADGGEE